MSDPTAARIKAPPEERRLDVGSAELEVTLGGYRTAPPEPGAPAAARGAIVAAAHPADAFGPAALDLLAEAAQAEVVVVNPRGLGRSTPKSPSQADATLPTMVDDLEAARRALGFGAWVFWGMSGGGFLALEYVHRYPEAIAGLILDSTCACFRARLQDPACIASPFHPAWQGPLAAAGLAAGAVGEEEAGLPGEWVTLEGGATAYVTGGAARMVSPVAMGPAMHRAMPALLAYDARAWLGAIRVPVLVLCGTEDVFAPLAHSSALHEGIAGSELLAIEGAGHVPVTARHPEVSEGVRRFLRSIERH
jgi:pimeloyl-ACP methyl ester carboxylesterase